MTVLLREMSKWRVWSSKHEVGRCPDEVALLVCDEEQRNDATELLSGEVVRIDHAAVRCPGETVLTSCDAVR